MEDIENVLLYCKLDEIMKQRDISANHLSIEINERRSTINDLRNNNDMGTRHIPARLIAKLCFYLDVTPSDLFEVRKST